MLLNPSHVNKSLDIVTTTDELKNATVELIQLSESDNNNFEAKRKLTLIDNWSAKIDDLIDDYFNSFNQWQRCLDNERLLVLSSSIVRRIDNKVNAEDVYEYFRWLIARLDNFLHLKDLDKPTIVLVAGTSGVGKSTISRYLSKTLGIPTGFSSDVASRSVMREAIVFLLGNEAAEQLYPEIFGSSFDQNTSNWFYAQSLMTMVGVIGNIKRLISENISSVIDGVALIPGTLPEIYFEKANVVWVVASVKDKQQHYQRLGMRSETGLERGGAEHYWKQFEAIRNNHDRLVEMAEKSQTFIVDNSASLDDACQKVFDRVSNAIADRGLPVVDEIRDSVRKSLHERTTWEVQNHIMPRPVDNEY
jgi:2-phosphoglycerate kinase